MAYRSYRLLYLVDIYVDVNVVWLILVGSVACGSSLRWAVCPVSIVNISDTSATVFSSCPLIHRREYEVNGSPICMEGVTTPCEYTHTGCPPLNYICQLSTEIWQTTSIIVYSNQVPEQVSKKQRKLSFLETPENRENSIPLRKSKPEKKESGVIKPDTHKNCSGISLYKNATYT